jgi:putative ABC transport system ATP-binding protein
VPVFRSPLLEHMEIDLGTLATRAVAALSTGQQQRVAVARALIGAPRLVIADEPTSALDHGVRDSFMELLFREVEEVGATLLFVSHDSSLAPRFDRRESMAGINDIAAAS